MSNFEKLLLQHTEKQLSLLQEQSSFYQDWLRHDRKDIDRLVSQESFAQSNLSENWEASSFTSVDGTSEVRGKWASLDYLHMAEGLYIGNRIIRCKEKLNLRSLALEVKVEARISLNSEIWILTRGTNVKDPNCCIVKISRESDIDGTFIVFGSPIGIDNDFMFFKRQQIPEQKFNPNEEFINVELKVKDNGDDRVYTTVKLSSFHSIFQTYCNKYLPTFNDFQVMISGLGRNVFVKSATVQLKERSSLGIIIEASKRQQCCDIF